MVPVAIRVASSCTANMSNAGERAHSDAGPWSRLWSTGVLHSCATGIHGNYDGAVLEFWQRQFDSLEDGSRLVDVGTGNGALLLLARQRAGERGIQLSMHGVDIADIDPGRAVADGAGRFDGIRFHPRTSVCSLPFGDGEVDLVCSQFGIEYAPRAAALAEIARVAARRSRVALVVHSSDSIIAQVAAPQREGLLFLREQCPIIEEARKLTPVLFQATQSRWSSGTPDAPPGAEATRLAFNRSAGALMDAIERMPMAQVLKNVAQQVQGALRHAYRSPDEAEIALRRLEEGLQDEDARLQQLEQAMLSADDLDALAGHLGDHGYAVRHAPLLQRGAKFGWTVVASRG